MDGRSTAEDRGSPKSYVDCSRSGNHHPVISRGGCAAAIGEHGMAAYLRGLAVTKALQQVPNPEGVLWSAVA